MAYSKGMASGLPARVVIVCAVFMTAQPMAHAQVPPTVPADRPPVSSPTAATPPAAPGAQQTIAQASGRRQVAVIDLATERVTKPGDPPIDPAAERLANELYNALVNHIDLRPLTNPTFVSALKGRFLDEEASFLAAARVAKHDAEEFLVQLDYASAERTAANGIKELHNVRPSPEVLGLYAEIAFDWGQAALRLRNPNGASLAFGLSNRLDPAKRPDAARYEPDIVDAYSLAVTKIPVQAKLEVKGTGTVWIDGVDRGPPGVFDVSHGLHLVQLSGPERETRGRQVNVPADREIGIDDAPATEERKVQRLRIELAQTQDAAARAGAVKRLAQLLGVGDAVLIEKSETGTLRVQTWRDNKSGFSAKVEHDKEPPGDLLVPLAPPPKLEPKPKPKQDFVPLPPTVAETPFYKKRWFYGSVAVGVVAAAIYVIVAATKDGMVLISTDVKPEGE